LRIPDHACTYLPSAFYCEALTRSWSDPDAMCLIFRTVSKKKPLFFISQKMNLGHTYIIKKTHEVHERRILLPKITDDYYSINIVT
jgi:hypothetical protein